MQGIDNVYNLSMKDRASQIVNRIKSDGIYGLRAASNKFNASMPILSNISKRWKKTGQQNNAIRVLVADAL